MQSYLPCRKKRTEINTAYSSWEGIRFNDPQDSILGPLLLNIFICDLLSVMIKVDFASYFDDVKAVINYLKEASDKLFHWFPNNQVKVNPEKCHCQQVAETK